MTDENDIELEPEDAPESRSAEDLLDKIKKLKEELKQVKVEKQEYLDGWQRMRADTANAKRDQQALMGKIEAAKREEVISDIIPILDSFDSAMQGEQWSAVDAKWRKGVEYIRAQCVSVLDKYGIMAFGKEGEPFDPSLHEAAQEIEADAESGTIMRVIRRGYKNAERIIRPAQVIIAK